MGLMLFRKKYPVHIYYYHVDGSWSGTNPSPWPASSLINKGFDPVVNNIKVINAGGGNFDIYFNGSYETSFKDATFTGGYSGFYASVGSASKESFPTPVDVRFKLLSDNK
jgi:hypothetical protein